VTPPLRFLPRLRSVRARLMVWNIGAPAIMLVLLGGILQYSVRTYLLSSIDQELENRIRPMILPPPNRPPGAPPELGRRPEGPPGFDPENPDLRPGRPGMASPFSPDPENPPPAPRPPVPLRADSIPGDLIPRMLSLEGKTLSPNQGEGPWDARGFDRAAAGQGNFTLAIWNDEPIRVDSQPLRVQGHIVAVVQAVYPMTEVNNAVGWIDRTLLMLLPVALLLAGIGGALLTDRALRPVGQIAQTAAHIGAQDLSRRLEVVGGDEFAALAATINGMLGRLHLAFSEQQSLVHELERMVEQQRRFTADASHELRTPLTIVKANTSLALRGTPTEGEYREVIEDIDLAADTMARLVRDLLLLARSDAGQLGHDPIPLPLKEILDRARTAISTRATAPILLDCPDPELMIDGVPDELVRLFSNLLANAIRYTPLNGMITISVRTIGQMASIAIVDTGCGIASEHLPHLGERFYRVDSARSRPDGGAGLGLSICKSIAQGHGGTLRIESIVDQGTTVTVTLPLHRK